MNYLWQNGESSKSTKHLYCPFLFSIYIFRVFFFFLFFCLPSEASTWYCAIPGFNQPRDWQSLQWAGEEPDFNQRLCFAVRWVTIEPPLLLKPPLLLWATSSPLTSPPDEPPLLLMSRRSSWWATSRPKSHLSTDELPVLLSATYSPWSHALLLWATSPPNEPPPLLRATSPSNEPPPLLVSHLSSWGPSLLLLDETNDLHIFRSSYRHWDCCFNAAFADLKISVWD